ncbi:DUF6531 domain-containing protein, partial [Xanthomonas nasturtii]
MEKIPNACKLKKYRSLQNHLFIFTALLCTLGIECAYGDENVNQCPPSNYPYTDRPCNEGQAYVEANRQSILTLKNRKDFKGPARIERDSGYNKYEAFCKANFSWIPFTGCGVAYYRPGATCASLPSVSNPNAATGSLTCDQGCEFLASAEGVQSPTGEVCSPPPPIDPAKNNCCNAGGPVTAANPVNMFTGVKLESSVDYRSPLGGLEFTRYYNSAIGLRPVADLGNGWRHSYSRSIDTIDASTVKVNRASGDSYIFKKRTGTWLRDQDVPYQLTEVSDPGSTGARWVLNAPDRTVENFDIDGHLIQIIWPTGDSVSLSYSNGLLESATDKSGRRISFIFLISPIPQPWKLLAMRKTRSGQGMQ